MPLYYFDSKSVILKVIAYLEIFFLVIVRLSVVLL